MSWSEPIAKVLKALMIIGALAMLAGCSGFRPVYGEAGIDTGRYHFFYPDPGSRLDQIIYTELRLRLGPHSGVPKGSYRVIVRTSAGARGLTKTAVVKPASNLEVVVTAQITVVSPAGKVIFSGTRKTSAYYQTMAQVLADTEAQTEATERGAKALADTVRLAILGALSTQ